MASLTLQRLLMVSFFGRSASHLALTYGELNLSAPLNFQLLEPLASRLALTYGELNPSAPFNGQLLRPSAWRQLLFDGVPNLLVVDIRLFF